VNVDALRAFLVITETGSFSTAARQLHLTQPAVSKRIALLESQLGARLFERTGRSVSLTEAGDELAPRAKQILLSIEDSKRAIHNLSGRVSGTLSLATSHHIGLWRLPPLLREYAAHHPQVSLDLHFMDSVVANELVLQGKLELAIATLAPAPDEPDERLRSVPIWDDRLVFVVASDHPLAAFDTVTLAQLADHTAILPDLSTYTGRIVKQLFDTRGLQLQVAMSTNYLETVKMLISIGLGWSVLPCTMLDEGTHALQLPDLAINRTLGYLHHAGRTLSNAAKAFLQLVELHRDPCFTEKGVVDHPFR
jgi:DNA-binding transcriptional LysR family regulator|tara:strand:+ start:159 stop:1082 length:924 start_codon:yes stop_codon:yes gene_type:complete